MLLTDKYTKAGLGYHHRDAAKRAIVEFWRVHNTGNNTGRQYTWRHQHQHRAEQSRASRKDSGKDTTLTGIHTIQVQGMHIILGLQHHRSAGQ
jgi:hypothetical protein